MMLKELVKIYLKDVQLDKIIYTLQRGYNMMQSHGLKYDNLLIICLSNEKKINNFFLNLKITFLFFAIFNKEKWL